MRCMKMNVAQGNIEKDLLELKYKLKMDLEKLKHKNIMDEIASMTVGNVKKYNRGE